MELPLHFNPTCLTLSGDFRDAGLCAGQIVLPPSPSGSPGVRENMCVIKKGGALEKKGDFGDYIGRGK